MSGITSRGFNLGILQYVGCVCEMFDMANLLPPPKSKNQAYHEATWDTKDVHFKQDIIHMAINDGLHAPMLEQVKKNNCYYHTIPTKELIGLLGILQDRNDRRLSDCEPQKPTTKKKKSQQPDGFDVNSQLRPRDWFQTTLYTWLPITSVWNKGQLNLLNYHSFLHN